MAQAYLFVHFREKTTPDGEQVYFGISRDGFHWEAVNDGAPVLWAQSGDKGVRDFTITHSIETGKYYIFATDLSQDPKIMQKRQCCRARIARNRFEGVPGYDENL